MSCRVCVCVSATISLHIPLAPLLGAFSLLSSHAIPALGHLFFLEDHHYVSDLRKVCFVVSNEPFPSTSDIEVPPKSEGSLSACNPGILSAARRDGNTSITSLFTLFFYIVHSAFLLCEKGQFRVR